MATAPRPTRVLERVATRIGRPQLARWLSEHADQVAASLQAPLQRAVYGRAECPVVEPPCLPVRRAAEPVVALDFPIYSSLPYLSRTLHRGLVPECDRVQDVIAALKEGSPRAAEVVAGALAQHPALRGFRGVVVPVPRSEASRPSLLPLAEALVGQGVGTRAAAAIARARPVESSRMRRRRGLPGITAAEHAGTLRVTGSWANEPVLLVDDIHTTGATLQAAAGALRAAGQTAPIIAATAGWAAEPPQDCEVEPWARGGTAPPVDPLDAAEAFTKALARKMQGLKRALGARRVAQNYKGTGSKRADRQVYVHLADGDVDVWLERTGWRIGGVIDRRPRGATRPYPRRGAYQPDLDATWLELLAALQAWAGVS